MRIPRGHNAAIRAKLLIGNAGVDINGKLRDLHGDNPVTQKYTRDTENRYKLAKLMSRVKPFMVNGH